MLRCVVSCEADVGQLGRCRCGCVLKAAAVLTTGAQKMGMKVTMAAQTQTSEYWQRVFSAMLEKKRTRLGPGGRDGK
jgi:hypothetical protein